MANEWEENSNQENKAKAPVLEGQEIKLINEQGVTKEYVVVIIDSEGVHLAEWDFNRNEPTGMLIKIPPESYDRTFGLPTS